MVVFKNSDTSGARFEGELPVGEHPLQLYSMGTPNGQKITILLEELGVAYDGWLIDILKGENFSSGFIALSPNEKIPVLVDKTDGEDFTVFESGAILCYLGDKYKSPLYPEDARKRSVVTQWLMWQMGSAPYFGQFGHFWKYAPEQIPYAKTRYKMEVKRLLDVLDKQLERTGAYVAGSEYTIADIAIAPWITCLDVYYKAKDELELDKYTHVQRWLGELMKRDAFVRGWKRLTSSEEKHCASSGK